jgi:hypothetical protein
LEDDGRALFLSRKDLAGNEAVELPHIFIQKGENPVSSLAAGFRRLTGIDAQVHEILFEREYNAGSRKRKAFIPAIVFKVTAKNSSAKIAAGFSGYRWISSTDLPKFRKAKIIEWLR